MLGGITESKGEFQKEEFFRCFSLMRLSTFEVDQMLTVDNIHYDRMIFKEFHGARTCIYSIVISKLLLV